MVDTVCSGSLLSRTGRKYRETMNGLWRHSLACAHAAEHLMGERSGEEDPYTLGLLHDIGKLALLQIVAALEAKGRFDGGLDRSHLNATLIAHHGEFGAALLEKWGFSETFQRVARAHHDPQALDPPCPEAFWIRLADLVAKEGGYGADVVEIETAADSLAARHLEIDPARVEAAVARVVAVMEGTGEALS